MKGSSKGWVLRVYGGKVDLGVRIRVFRGVFWVLGAGLGGGWPFRIILETKMDIQRGIKGEIDYINKGIEKNDVSVGGLRVWREYFEL